MSMWIKGAIAALALAGSAFVATEPAQARVSIGIGIGVPGPYYGPYRSGYDPACDRYSRWYNPYRCDAEYYDDGYYDGPIFVDGFWYDGRWRSRWHNHHREFFYRNHWREGRWDDHHHGGHHHH
jgi:hypothetical protein